jgi:hypothetical protein
MKSFREYLEEAVAEDQYGGGFGGGGVAPVTDTTSPIHGRDVEEDEDKRNYKRSQRQRSGRRQETTSRSSK